MEFDGIKFAVIGDCHHTHSGNLNKTRDCTTAKKRLETLIDQLNEQELDFVMSLGDLGDGRSDDEIPEILEVYKRSKNPVYFTIGNHDLHRRNATEVAKLFGIPAPFYDFKIKNFRLIVLNAFERSRYSYENKDDMDFYWNYVETHKWRKMQEWPGFMTDASFNKLKNILDNAKKDGENVIMFSHVPVLGEACDQYSFILDFSRLLNLMDKYDNIRAYFAGHMHSGGFAFRNGVLHKTMEALCETLRLQQPKPNATIVTADDTKMVLDGIGNEPDLLHVYEQQPATISGTAPEGCYVMTNCGEIMRVGKDGKFCLKVPAPAPVKYAIKAVMDGHEDQIHCFLSAPSDTIRIEMKPNPERKLYTGKTDGYAVMKITDDGEPVRWFDISGRSYGAFVPDNPDAWVEHSDNYWTNGEYAFTAKGEVKIRILPKHPALKADGWYKGDIHAHLIHYEEHYIGNVPQSAFIGKAENYDFLYLAGGWHTKDQPLLDDYKLAEYENTPDFKLMLNVEFPKAKSNHFASIGIREPQVRYDHTAVSSLHVADEFVWQLGGITVPVHPFEGHMSCRQLPIWINCAPEKLSCIDFFYHDDYDKRFTEDYWFMLLNRGYKIGCFATSDAAFDVGRTPGSDRGCTYLPLDTVSEPNIVKAILEHRTMVSWDCAALRFNIDDAIIGDTLVPDGKLRKIKIKALWRENQKGFIRIIRNGEDIEKIPVSFDSDEAVFEYEKEINETENSWYLVIMEKEDGTFRSAASPIYFRNSDFKEPEVLPTPKSFPAELLAEYEALTPEELSDPELIDITAEKIKALL